MSPPRIPSATITIAPPRLHRHPSPTLTQLIKPPRPSYVLLTAASTFALSLWHAFRVPFFRKPARVSYPQHYITEAEIADAASDPPLQRAKYLYNCAQRAHGQFNEHYPPVLCAMLVAGVAYPRLAAALGAAWAVNRVLFARGYTSAGEKNKVGGKGRSIGTGYLVAELGLYGLVAWVGLEMLWG